MRIIKSSSNSKPTGERQKDTPRPLAQIRIDVVRYCYRAPPRPKTLVRSVLRPARRSQRPLPEDAVGSMNLRLTQSQTCNPSQSDGSGATSATCLQNGRGNARFSALLRPKHDSRTGLWLPQSPFPGNRNSRPENKGSKLPSRPNHR